MPITFECECGEQISVPDGMEGRIALCATCRKTQRIPGEASGDDASAVSGLFREALAAFGEAEEGDGAQATREQAEVPSEADTRLMDGPKRSGGSAAAGGPSKPEPEEALQIVRELGGDLRTTADSLVGRTTAIRLTTLKQ